ncbi:isoprenylcysteine carboxylmethyltransferase family protein [Gammaproteobacteria bacterium]|nr:isoprenylcysteine carboxylmethyltransferase family protein [Gammaproteobacteria bacterium]
MSNKIPPPIVTLFFGICIYLSRPYFPEFSFSILNSLSTISFVLGITVFASAVSSFKRQNTTVNPISIEKASSLVVNGVFKYSRNPMYLGMLFILLGLTFKFNLIGGLLFTSLFMIFISIFQIKPEEAAMEKLFDQEWRDYIKNVRRWL